MTLRVGIGGETSANETKNHFDLNKVSDGVEECMLDLNKLPAEWMDFGFESEELNKGINEMMKIYLGSLYY